MITIDAKSKNLTEVYLSDKKISHILNKYIHDFIVHLKELNKYSNTTIYLHIKYIELFDRYLYYAFPNVKLDEINESIINSYIIFCTNQLNNTHKTVNKKLSSLYKFFKYMTNCKYIYKYNIVSNVSYLPNEDESPPTIISSGELLILFDTMRKYIYGYRDICICKIILETGLNTKDILELKLDQLSIHDHTLLINSKKKQEAKLYHLSSNLINDLQQYMSIRTQLDKKNSNYLFLSIRGSKYSIRSFQLFFEEATNRCLDTKYLPRHLRSTFIYNISNLVDSDRLQRITGQRKVTQYYELNDNPLRNLI